MKFLIALVLTFVSTAYAATAPQVFDVKVDEAGYTPSEIKVAPGSTVELRLTRTTDDTCATEIVIPSMKIEKKLPLNKPVSVTLKNLKKGEIKFGCHMDLMLSGVIQVQ
jgi:plastocyanin domain-containing protein